MIQGSIDAATARNDSPARSAARKHMALMISLKLGTPEFDSISVFQRV